jgi:hypothetical protein
VKISRAGKALKGTVPIFPEGVTKRLMEVAGKQRRFEMTRRN